ncbi:APC amino acid permease [Russula aff. rugulosa BPL654]|nr:APC amino acid permease [Russula aff. rugulosa BPL654]
MPDSNSVTKDSHTAETGGVYTGDETELARMGYKQELKRDLTLIQNFGVSFSIISILTGIPPMFLFGLTTGGPAVMVWGFIVVASEICSAHPTSGGPYYWAAMISKPQGAPFASWVTGWFNLLGQIAVTTGIGFSCADFISTAATIASNYEPSPPKTVGIFAAVLFAQGMINTFGVHIRKYMNSVSVWWHVLGTTAIITSILAAAPKHQSGKFVFRTFIDDTGLGGIGWSQRASPAYVAVIGILMAQYTLTHNAAMSGPIGIVMSIGVSAILGWILILGLLFSIQDYETTVASSTGQPGTIVLMCGAFSVTSNSRMIYAFSRDGAIPGSKFLHKVDHRWRSPIRAVWLVCALSFILGLPSFGSSVAFSAATSIATIGLYISYGIPIALRVIYADRFVRGPFHLSKFSYPISIAAVLWIAFISVAFCLPELNPVSTKTLNYAPVAVGIVLTYALGFWTLSARTWFTGPVKQITDLEKGRSANSPEAVVTSEKAEFLEM